MSRSTRTIATIIIVVVVLGLIALAYIWFSGGSGAPSATLSAPTLAIATRQPTLAPTTEATAEATAESTMEATAESTMEATAESTMEATTEPTEAVTAEAVTAEATTAATAQAAAQAAADLGVFNIASDQSEVSFTLSELLRGTKNEVVGKTDQVAGQIAVDFGTPSNSQIGEIRIDARTLATDDAMRDRTTRGQILQSAQDKYEFISFKPTEMTGLPASVTMGTAFSFQVTGDLTIRDITKPVTFDVTVTPDSQTQISGSATATVLRSDFELNIPSLPMIADVDDAVKLDITFVALAAS